MSDQLAISASFSVLMMSIYVLFGGDAVAITLGPQDLQAPGAVAAPESLGNPGTLLNLR